MICKDIWGSSLFDHSNIEENKANKKLWHLKSIFFYQYWGIPIFQHWAPLLKVFEYLKRQFKLKGIYSYFLIIYWHSSYKLKRNFVKSATLQVLSHKIRDKPVWLTTGCDPISNSCLIRILSSELKEKWVPKVQNLATANPRSQKVKKFFWPMIF